MLPRTGSSKLGYWRGNVDSNGGHNDQSLMPISLIDEPTGQTRPEPGAPSVYGGLKMSFRSGLVLASGVDAASAIDVAFQLAARSNGHVTGLHVSGDPISNMPSIVEGTAERQIIMEFEKARDRVETNERVSRETFVDACAKHGGTMIDTPAPTAGVIGIVVLHSTTTTRSAIRHASSRCSKRSR